MSSALYLTLMIGVVAVITAFAVPPILFPRCPACRRRNPVERRVCRACGAALPEDED